MYFVCTTTPFFFPMRLRTARTDDLKSGNAVAAAARSRPRRGRRYVMEAPSARSAGMTGNSWLRPAELLVEDLPELISAADGRLRAPVDSPAKAGGTGTGRGRRCT